jgi:hypothetical protein
MGDEGLSVASRLGDNCTGTGYRGFPIKFRGCEPIKNFFNKRGNLNIWCLGKGQVSYLPIDQKFIGVVSTKTEI